MTRARAGSVGVTSSVGVTLVGLAAGAILASGAAAQSLQSSHRTLFVSFGCFDRFCNPPGEETATAKTVVDGPWSESLTLGGSASQTSVVGPNGIIAVGSASASVFGGGFFENGATTTVEAEYCFPRAATIKLSGVMNLDNFGGFGETSITIEREDITWFHIELTDPVGLDPITLRFDETVVIPPGRGRIRVEATAEACCQLISVGDAAFDVAISFLPLAGTCLGDLTLDGKVDGADLGAVLGNWGKAGLGDLDCSGEVDGADLGSLLAAWGPCI